MDITTGKTTLLFFMLVISFCLSFVIFFFFYKRWIKYSERRDQSGALFIQNIHLAQVTFPSGNPSHTQPDSPSSLYLSDLNAMLLEIDEVVVLPNHSINGSSKETMNIPIDYSTTDQPLLTEIVTVVDARDLNQIKH